ncbi:XAF1_3 [Blepharisma stoltei]|uniref:TRAFD1/XAF1 zinc finger domain-containing protein n=1 Tax=Blepharisma stoltei TaxID=1481888 RepID=A0AAU9JMN8_9CILI|nr:unnamed protein product [Blepharisma stoltei]
MSRFCKNCEKEISEDVFMLHEAHCERFLCKCPECGEAVPKSFKDQHIQDVHPKEKCPFCYDLIEKSKLEAHKLVCDSKPRPCEHCGAIMEISQMIDHEDACGNRTEQCDICQKFITLKAMPEHIFQCMENLDKPNSNAKKRKPNEDAKAPRKRMKRNKNDWD